MRIRNSGPSRGVKLRYLGMAIAVAGLGLASGSASAESPSVDQIIRALQGNAPSRVEASAPESDATARGRKRAFSAKERGDMPAQRVQMAEAPKPRPSLDMEIYFEFNSAEIKPQAVPDLDKLGTALSSPALQGSRFLIAGHTDAKGGDEYNRLLSQRRAASVRQYLVGKFRIDPSRLDSVGYGKTRPKVPDDPYDGANRRVQIVNQGVAVADLPPPVRPKR